MCELVCACKCVFFTCKCVCARVCVKQQRLCIKMTNSDNDTVFSLLGGVGRGVLFKDGGVCVLFVLDCLTPPSCGS